ncbi:MAG: TIGR00341 family protein [Melioribacteraceae bacterium]|nr:TIGR00341 family protein [Melioribacteraceae bacterium]
MKVSKRSRLLVIIKDILKDRFNLDEDKEDELKTIETIRKGVEFRGTNLWVLIFAIMIASVGLNVNSTAVIIGAMLISPLMGPIMGIGMGVGINDLKLIKTSFKNLAISVVFSVLTSTLYFLISPLGDAQSELLARTTPTIWDVLIALFGGLAGIVAASRKHVSNVVPGVAIATALMPPLCTAGYGLAQGNLSYFLGAFYLFFINSVFISLSTFIIVRFLKYPQQEYPNKEFERKVKMYILIIVGITVIPSVYLGYEIVEKSIFTRNANLFLNNEMNFSNVFIVGKNIVYDRKQKLIEVFTIGEINNEKIASAKSKLKNYNLEEANLVVKQSGNQNQKINLADIRSGLIEDLYRKNEELIKNKDEKIALLERELTKTGFDDALVKDIFNEAKSLNKSLKELFITRVILASSTEKGLDTLSVVYTKFNYRQSGAEIKKLETWLLARLKIDKLRLVVQ